MAESLIAANWKMNTTLGEAEALVAEMKPGLSAIEGIGKVLCPPFVSLALVHALVEGSDIGVGAQNMHFESQGAFTGEISPQMVSELCDYVILGHSERRTLFGETDALIGKKVASALGSQLTPILCVGEQLADREAGRAETVVEGQLRSALDGVAAATIVVAYEPVWAIGTGRAATPDDAQAVMAHMRGVLATLYGDGHTSGVSLLYGGSVSADNVASFVREPDIDGALVGGASLKAQSFIDLVASAAEALG